MKNVNSDVAYDFIRKRILSGEYPPGHALISKAISLEIGISRTPVRDALRQLSTDGLVLIQPHLGASVKAMDLTQYRELCGMRLALESYSAGLAASQRTAANLREIRHALEAMRELNRYPVPESEEQNVIAQLGRQDVRFHIAILNAAGSDLVKKHILRLHLINRVVTAPAPGAAHLLLAKKLSEANRRAVLQSHDEIFAAIEAGDPLASKRAMEAHLQDVIDKNLRLMSGEEEDPVFRELTEEELIYST